MVFVNELELPVESESQAFTASEGLTAISPNIRTLNDSLGILLRSYTRAINIQNRTSGALFRRKTKAECVNCNDGVTPSYLTVGGVTQINIEIPERQYPQLCFNYIHDNPVKAGLVTKPELWGFSSAIDYAGLRDGRLVNKEIAVKFGFI